MKCKTEEEKKEARKEYLKQYHKQYYQKNKEKIVEQNKHYYKQYYQDNKEKKAEYYKQWYETNKEKRADYLKQWREQNSDYSKQYRKTPMGRALYLVGNHNHEDKKKNRGECSLTALWVCNYIFPFKCIYCGEDDWTKLGCDRKDNSLPHTPSNVVPCCGDCNTKRGSKPFEEFVAECNAEERLKEWEEFLKQKDLEGIATT